MLCVEFYQPKFFDKMLVNFKFHNNSIITHAVKIMTKKPVQATLVPQPAFSTFTQFHTQHQYHQEDLQ